MGAIVGIDVSKEKLDVCLVDANGKQKQESFAKNKSGINKLHRWLKKQDAKAQPYSLNMPWVIVPPSCKLPL